MANIYLKADKHEAIIKAGKNVNEFVDMAVEILLTHPELETKYKRGECVS